MFCVLPLFSPICTKNSCRTYFFIIHFCPALKFPYSSFFIEDFTKKNFFHRVLNDHADSKKNELIELAEDKKIKKVVICSGKIYFDLLQAREKNKNKNVFIIRIEQLYPFPVKTLAKELKRFRKKSEFCLTRGCKLLIRRCESREG